MWRRKKLGKIVLVKSYSIRHKWNLNLRAADNLPSAYNYVRFRNHHVDEATVKEVLKEQQYKIDASQLLDLRADQCQKVEP